MRCGRDATYRQAALGLKGLSREKGRVSSRICEAEVFIWLQRAGGVGRKRRH